MKKVISLLLCMCGLFSLCACGAPESDGPGETEKVWEPTPYDDIVADPKTWYEAFNALPIANANMTTEELRQLCVDYFRLQLSFMWTPNKDIVFTSSKGKPCSLPTGLAYSGMLYNNNSGMGGGNLYKAVKYYNPETGVMDVAGMKDMYNVVASHCSWGAMMAWNRVSNTNKMFTMGSFVESCGAIPVGPYKYVEAMVNLAEPNPVTGERDGSTQIIMQNGDQVMYESYAQMLPGDGVYSSPAYHVEMCSIAPVVVRNADNTINPDESYLHLCDQNAYGTSGSLELEKQSDGTPLRTLGGVDTKVTFKWLLTSGYIPFTIAEFLGTDPVEEGKAWIGNEHSGWENDKDTSMSMIFQSALYANYAIANVKISVKNADGKVLMSYDPELSTIHRTYSVNLKDAYDADKLAAYTESGKNRIAISVQLTTGAWVDAFETVLKN